MAFLGFVLHHDHDTEAFQDEAWHVPSSPCEHGRLGLVILALAVAQGPIGHCPQNLWFFHPDISLVAVSLAGQLATLPG